jgi:hypothetical protein
MYLDSFLYYITIFDASPARTNGPADPKPSKSLGMVVYFAQIYTQLEIYFYIAVPWKALNRAFCLKRKI